MEGSMDDAQRAELLKALEGGVHTQAQAIAELVAWIERLEERIESLEANR